jgi:DHA1 family bicyclomycin/chloramphenicol resistance-like MFS transporter
MQVREVSSRVGGRQICVISCLLTFIAQLGVTLYLPALPDIENELGFDTGRGGNSLLLYFIGAAAPQLFWGALADRAGRKRLLTLSLVVFSIASLVAGITQNSSIFMTARFFQGVGAGGGAIIGRILMQDISSGSNLAKNLSYLSLSFICALGGGQFLGGIIQQHFHWSLDFLLLFLLGVIMLVTILVSPLPSGSARSQSTHISNYVRVLKMKTFVRPMLAGALGYGVLVIFYEKGPYVFQQVLALSSQEYGNIGLLVGIAYGIGTLLVKKLVVVVGVQKLMMYGLRLMFFAGILLVGANWSHASMSNSSVLPVLVIFIYCVVALGQALLFPNSMATAISAARSSGSYATALCSFLQQLIAVIVGSITMWFGEELFTPLAAVVVVISLVGMALIRSASTNIR